MKTLDEAARDRFRRRTIEKTLASQMEDAREASRLATLRFQEIVSTLPTGIPQPDGTLHIREARREFTRARIAFDAAQERWLDFLTEGIVPEDLKPERLKKE